ncbi:hypothetical protein CHS0354_036055 [Potamilus streckersoni]|uniref:BTB domain-containing protein n=1 Tax=Potamilus streckersoni TaxID=2493646 RepID=A0AAE0VX79_9BIVA|nr:hypothetical protein CHS0354_036055 [Potamilus streckersoni]
MEVDDDYIGLWRIVECVSLAGIVETTGIEGTEFFLDESGDVSWKVSEDAEPMPFFNCETYEIQPKKGSTPAVLKFYGTYEGHVIDFKVEISDDLMLLTYEKCCLLQCQKISSSDPRADILYSFLPALEEEFFWDISIRADSGREFKVHSLVLCLSTPDVNWFCSPPPLTGLQECVIQTVLHYLYAECLPQGLMEEVARACIKSLNKMHGFGKFVDLCQTFLKNTNLKHQITSMVNDMHACADKIIDLFGGGGGQGGSEGVSHQMDRSLIDNPAKLCYVVKQAVREGAVAISKLLMMCDLFSRRKGELSREERHDIIKYTRSRIPFFLSQLEKFLEVCKKHTSAMSVDERHEIATYLVPEIESSLDMVSKFVSDIKAALEQIINTSEKEKPADSKHDKSKKGSGHISNILGKTLKNALHLRELKKLKRLNDRASNLFFLFVQKKDTFSSMSDNEKVRYISRGLDSLVDQVPTFLSRLQIIMSDLEVKLTKREWKYLFKLGTSKIAWGIYKVENNHPTLEPLVQQVCDTVHRDQFTSSLVALGLSKPRQQQQQQGGQDITSEASSSSTQNVDTRYIQLSAVESLCVPPFAHDSVMAKMALELLRSGNKTDMTFEIIVAQDVGDTVIDHTGSKTVERTESDRDVEITYIPAHCVVIATHCEWFKRALLSGMKESIDKKITVHDTNPDLFRVFLEYLYSGQMETNDLSTEQLVDIMTLADRYHTLSLKSLCEQALKHHVDDENALYLLSFADQLNAKKLKDLILNYVAEHPEVTSSELYQDLPEYLQMEVETVSVTGLDSRSHSLTNHSYTDVPSSASSISEVDEMINTMPFVERVSNDLTTSSSSEDIPPIEDAARLENCVESLRDVVGDSIPREQLVQVSLAADYDLNRALNFLFP